ncbi:hypothetical protein GGR27_000412 [Lewinella antarctica]|uniref:Sulfatase N-terminal domain-containing protein n=2 Tax=Neolewinella antarctica TaxID=442734 RepID=A0ABX0X6S9_9BACT|nr:hypothetical protein [Neolewinella antarctica]
MLAHLEATGELENTIVIVTSDNGMPFPRAKANAYECGVHVPLAIRYPANFPGGRTIRQPVGFIDLAPTILEATGTASRGMLPITGTSLLKLLRSNDVAPDGDTERAVFSGRERHSSARYLNRGYPQRSVRKGGYLLVWNLKTDRWPAGAPQRYSPEDSSQLWPMHGVGTDGNFLPGGAYTDIDDCPAKTLMVEHYDDRKWQSYFELATAKRPEYELFRVDADPDCLVNLAVDAAYAGVLESLRTELKQELERTDDPRVVGPDREVFDS